MGEVFRVFATLGIDATEFDKGLAGAEQRLSGVQQSFTGAGRTLTAGLTVPIVGAAAGALTAAITFESAFAGVRKTVDATEEEFAVLERGIREMTTRIPVSAEQIAAVAEAAGQLGVQTDSILGFTEVMIGLGEATADMMPEEAAMQVARFMNIMQTAPADVERLASTIVGLGNNVAATEGEITLMGMRLAGAGNLIGLTEAEVLGLAATMSSLGIRAEAGGTAMSRVMRTIMNAVMAGGDDLETFAGIAGVSAETFATAFSTNPIEAIQLFSDGLGRIRDEGGNVNDALEAVSLYDTRVSDALLRMSGAGDVLASSINLATEAWSENTALAEEVGRRYETTESQLIMLWNALTEVSRTLGDVLIPFLLTAIEAAKPLLEGLKNLTEWFANLDPRMQQTIVTAAGIVAAIGPLMMIIGNLAGAIKSLLPIVRMIPGAFTAVRTAIGLLSGPIGWVVTAITLIATAWATDFMGFRTFIKEAWGWVVDAFRDVRDKLRSALNAIRENFLDWWDNVQTFFKGIPAQMLGFGKDIISGLMDGVKSMMTGAVDAVKGVGEGIISGFKNLLGIESPSKVFFEFGMDIGQGLADGIEASQPVAVAAIEQLGGVLASAGRAVISGALSAENIVGGLTKGLSPEAAIAAVEERLAVNQDTWRRLPGVSNMHGARSYMEGLNRMEFDALTAELRRLREEVALSRRETARTSEATTRRFSYAVDTFSQDVRGLTLAKQRY